MSKLTPHQQGYTEALEGSSTHYDLTLLVKPGTDLDSTFTAYDVECSEFIAVNGWLFSFEAGEMV